MDDLVSAKKQSLVLMQRLQTVLKNL